MKLQNVRSFFGDAVARHGQKAWEIVTSPNLITVLTVAGMTLQVIQKLDELRHGKKVVGFQPNRR